MIAGTVIGVVTLKPPMAPVPAPAPGPNVDVVPNAAFRLKTLSFILLPIPSPTSVKAFSLAYLVFAVPMFFEDQH